MTREKKKVAKKAGVAPDLREKKLQEGKGPMRANCEKRKGLTLSHLGDLIRSQPGRGGIRLPPPPPVALLSLTQAKPNLVW